MMANDKWEFGGKLSDSDWLHYLRFAAMPLLAVVLIIVILVMDRGSDGEGADMQTGAVLGDASGNGFESGQREYDDGFGAAGDSGEAAVAGDEKETEPEADLEENPEAYADIDISQYALEQDEDRELTALVLTYCQAKEEGDPELMASLFGKSGLTEKEIGAERERMELVRASIKRYENVTCYSVKGPVEDSYVIFPYFEIKYRGAEALMPELTWAYVTRNEEGRFVMHEDVTPAVAAYVARVGQKEDVVALKEQVADAMAEAVASDEKLKSIYSGESEVVLGASE